MSERLTDGLDVDPEVEEAWAAEVERRHAEIDSGEVSLLPGPETLAKLQAEFFTATDKKPSVDDAFKITPYR